ncbi:protein of unknown function [Tenacibaculum sp. 190524A02b]
MSELRGLSYPIISNKNKEATAKISLVAVRVSNTVIKEAALH